MAQGTQTTSRADSLRQHHLCEGFSDTRDAKLEDSRILCCSYNDVLRSGFHGKGQRNAKKPYEAPIEV